MGFPNRPPRSGIPPAPAPPPPMFLSMSAMPPISPKPPPPREPALFALGLSKGGISSSSSSSGTKRASAFCNPVCRLALEGSFSRPFLNAEAEAL
ncbi:hypothetical protein NEOLEDRAFT_521803 [Neolentinus lepideus HHB14362 ss-1]|uniref:Uncharacterized protein n=1 Tax=Neolentinus lepideus HHB14362 ss-1 TaxID=1314782 RepID=A0A165RIL5_9AGAM|nr:hypothetical protein NEOLEDRAFT_521803 [Neolentinus lepideus HHB14362 ss-1]